VTVTSTDIANQAIQMIGDNQPPVTGVAPTFDSSPAGVALSKIYAPCVQTVGRQFEWDMARSTIALTLSGNAAPFPWTLEYLYPTNGIEVWQLTPASLSDPYNPLPTTWVVANAVVTGAQKRVIHTNLASARAVYNNNPSEDTWDAEFRETVVRLLASELAIAIAGRPETADFLLRSAGSFEKIGEGRDS
jgi:hypothetical protein